MPPFVPRKRRASTPPLESPNPKAARKTPTAPPQTERLDAKSEKRKAIDVSNDESDDLSELASSDFEDVSNPSRIGPTTDSEDEEDHDDWEDAINTGKDSIGGSNTVLPTGDLELDLDKNARTASTAELYVGSKGPSKIEKEIRIQTHRMHVQFLLFHNVVRNGWLCDKEVQRILVEQLPGPIAKEVTQWRIASGLPAEDAPPTLRASRAAKKGKGKGTADQRQRDWGGQSERLERGRPDLSREDPLIALLKILSAYWKKTFTVTAPGLRKMGYKTPTRLRDDVASFQDHPHDPAVHGERVSDVREFRRLAKWRQGSRDVGAQLFTALLRGLGIETRMVANLQAVGFGWAQSENALVSARASDGETSMDKGKGGASKPAVKSARKWPPRRKRVGKPIQISDSEDLSSVDADSDSSDNSLVDVTPAKAASGGPKRYDQDLLSPIYWTEAISPISNEVIAVEAIVIADHLLPKHVATNPDHLASFGPRAASADKPKQVMAYVVAYSVDGSAKDVTTRYLNKRMWPGKTKGFRLPSEKVPVHNRRGKVIRYEEYNWFKDTMRHYTRDASRRTIVDELEEAKDLLPVRPAKKDTARDGDTLQSLKASADFVLERFLRREEALKPGSAHVRVFQSGKGEKVKEENVFLRKDVVRCLSAESWHKEGRKIRTGEQPLKRVPVRAVTLTRKREVQEAERESGEKQTQGLYSREQTEWIIPPPIKDGVIPKNSYGNIDCFVPSMVPKGAIHIPLRGTVKVCKKMEIDYAEAVTGFEFGNKMAIPVINGVVVAEEHEDAIIDAWEIEEEMKRRREEVKQKKLVLTAWKKFLTGLRIAQYMKDEYGDHDGLNEEEMNPFTRKDRRKFEHAPNNDADDPEGGGFMLEDDDSDEGPGHGASMIIEHGDERDRVDGAVSAAKEKAAYPRTPISSASSSKHLSVRREGVSAGSPSPPSELTTLPTEPDTEDGSTIPVAERSKRKKTASASGKNTKRITKGRTATRSQYFG